MGRKSGDATSKKRHFLKGRKLFTLMAMVSIGIIIYFIFFNKPKVEIVYPVVSVESVKQEDVNIYGEYVGRIRAQQFVEVRARVEGYLEKMLFSEGTAVEKNQVLFVIDPSTYKARAEKAKAQLKKDEAQAQKAKRDFERIKPLYTQNAVSQLDLDNMEAAYESSKATVEMSKADLKQAELELSYTIVKSPITGKISERNVDLGTLVGPGAKSLLATVVKSDTVFVDFNMTALDYQKSKERNIELGTRDSTRSWQPNVTVTLADYTVYPHRGFVDFAEPQVDPKTGTFSVRAELPNPQGDLLPGQSTRVTLLRDKIEDALIVPTKSIVREKGGDYIFVVNTDSIAKKTFVVLGQDYGNSTIVESGLREGEKIIVEGYNKLSPTTKVRIAPAAVESKKEEK